MLAIFCEKDRQLEILAVIGDDLELEEKIIFTDQHPDEAAIVFDGTLRLNPDWRSDTPALLFPAQEFHKEILLAFIYIRLGELEKAADHLILFPDLMAILHAMIQLTHSNDVSPNPFSLRNDSSFFHNRAIVLQYGDANTDEEEIISCWEQCLALPASALFSGYSMKHYALFLADCGSTDEAIELLRPLLATVLPSVVRLEYQILINSLILEQIREGISYSNIDSLRQSIADCIHKLEKGDRYLDAARCRQELAELFLSAAMFEQATNELELAIPVFEAEAIPDLVSCARLEQTETILSWAASGRPDLFAAALKSGKEALKWVDPAESPLDYSRLQHLLGIIYSELAALGDEPESLATKAIDSLNEAVNFYNKVEYPQQYGQVCHTMGNNYIRFLSPGTADSTKLALFWFRESLDIPSPEQFPLERAARLASYLHAAWATAELAEKRKSAMEDIRRKATELRNLKVDDLYHKVATDYLKRVEQGD